MKKMKIKKTIITGLVLTNTFLAAFGGFGILQPTVVSATESASKAIADETSTRSITIWKYQIKDSSELGNTGSGEKVETDKEVLSGIKFKIEKITAKDNASLTDPIKQKVGKDYELDNSFTAKTITTTTDGSAKIELGKGTSVDGIYLVTELPDDRGTSPSVAKPVDPFFVYVPQTRRSDLSSLIYNVEVQPKNILESLINPDKTVEGGKGYSIKAGQTFDWEATANIPAGLYTLTSQDMVITPIYDDNGDPIVAPNDKLEVPKNTKLFADYFKMTDTLNQELSLKDVVVQVKKSDDNWESLSLGTDYTVTINGVDKSSSPITADAGNTNKVEVSLVKPKGTESPVVGMEKVQAYDKIRVVYTTFTDIDYNGTIQNAFDVSFKSPGLKPVNPDSENNPESYSGGFDIEKTGEDTKAALKGAVFHIADSKSDADTNIFLGEDGKRYGKLDGTGSLKDAQEAATAANTKLLTSTTNDDGKATFNGLKLDWYTDTNSNGKQDLDEPTFAEADIKRSYWVVETTAPEGYELLKESKEVVVSLATKETIQLEVVDKKKTDLPFTGGAGSTLLVMIAIGAISVGTIAISIDKKRRQA
ncbi:SpaH/EbpB family LPXTG-anchored major pilin [Enterococcus sp. LJL99]